MSDNAMLGGNNPITFFRVKAEEAANQLTREKLLRTVDALSRFVGGTEISFDSFTDEFMDEWIVRLLYYGYTPSTVSNNILKRLATLYNKAVAEGIAKPSDIFREWQNRLAGDNTTRLTQIIDKQTFTKIHRLVDFSSAYLKSALAKDILLFAIYQGGMSFEDIANYRKEDYNGQCEPVLEIVRKYAKPKNRYLFPLNQTSLTPNQKARFVEALISEALAGSGLRMSANHSDTSFDLWSMAAISCGIPAASIAACLIARGYNGGLASFVKPAHLDTAQISEIHNRIATILRHNPVRWYAMHLRPYVSYDQLMARLKDSKISLERVYYPMEEIVSKVGRKKVFETRPVISWLIFFREKVTRLDMLFNEIGDLAWGYRYNSDFSSPYAPISDKEIADYQNALGTLSPDTPILSDNEVKLSKGDYLIVLGGAMDGRHGIFISEKRAQDGAGQGRIIYRIKLAGGQNANWIVDRDPRLVKKISADQFMELEHQMAKKLAN